MALDTMVVDLARAKLRIAQLELQAIERRGEVEKALRDQLDRYPSLGLEIAQLLWFCDANGDMTGEEPNWAAYTGQTREEYRGRGWLDAIHPDDRATHSRLWNAAVGARVSCEFEHRLRRRDGEYRNFTVGVAPTFEDDGTFREWAGIHQDVTERKLTEQLRRDGERRFRELADAMPQIVWGADAAGSRDYYNSRWYTYTGRSEGVAGDAGWADVIHPDDLAASQACWHSAVHSGGEYETVHRLRRRDGEYRWHLARALPVRDGGGPVVRWFGTCTDIHENRRTEERLRAATVSLTRSNRQLEEYASVASHDLQEPLRKIHSYVGCLRDEQAATLNAEGLEYLDRIQKAAIRMRTLISDLLELSHLSSKGKPFGPVDLNEAASGAVSDLEARIAETRGQVEIAAMPGAFGDASQLRQLLQNLIENALKFHRKGEAPLVRVSAEIVEGAVRLSVSDNGIGFDEKYLDRVFTIFQRLHGRGEYEGTGIGLAICRKIVERHGGTITARSKPGEGATFIATLPLTQQIEAANAG